MEDHKKNKSNLENDRVWRPWNTNLPPTMDELYELKIKQKAWERGFYAGLYLCGLVGLITFILYEYL